MARDFRRRGDPHVLGNRCEDEEHAGWKLGRAAALLRRVPDALPHLHPFGLDDVERLPVRPVAFDLSMSERDPPA
jgi:hypothetical protein